MKKRIPQPELFQSLPEGFCYRAGFLSDDEQAELLPRIRGLNFEQFDFRGYIARRRVVEYGWEYDFSSRKASATQPIPEFLYPLRSRAAQFVGIKPQELAEAVVIEYPPGAPMGWHRDVRQFEMIIGISLASATRMRLKPFHRKGRGEIQSVLLEPGSLYVMRDAARWQYQHSIPAVAELRYSITFRTLRKSMAEANAESGATSVDHKGGWNMSEAEEHKELTSVPGETGSGVKPNREQPGSKRDPEERPAMTEQEKREKNFDKTLADSFPTSDPPSSIPDPGGDEGEKNKDEAA